MKICGMCNDEGLVVVEDEMGLRHTAVCSWCGGQAPEQKAAQERTAKLQEENQRLRDQMAEQQAAWQQAGEECGRLRDLLRQVQWGWQSHQPFMDDEARDVCPWCDQTEEQGHAPDCPIGAELEGQG